MNVNELNKIITLVFRKSVKQSLRFVYVSLNKFSQQLNIKNF